MSRNWDARRSAPASLEAVAKLVKERPESFEEKTAKRASVAAAPLAAWVLANLQYGQILEQVAPLEREQRQLAEYEMRGGFSFLFPVIKKNLTLIF